MHDLYCSLVHEKTDKHSFEEAIQLLYNLMPQRNIPFERHLFQKIEQAQQETVTEFVCWLPHQASNCNFGANIDERIRDQVQVIEKCNSGELRAKFLEKVDLKPLDVLSIARAHEAVRERLEAMEPNFADNHEINVLRTRIDKTKLFCFACGKPRPFPTRSIMPCKRKKMYSMR